MGGRARHHQLQLWISMFTVFHEVSSLWIWVTNKFFRRFTVWNVICMNKRLCVMQHWCRNSFETCLSVCGRYIKLKNPRCYVKYFSIWSEYLKLLHKQFCNSSLWCLLHTWVNDTLLLNKNKLSGDWTGALCVHVLHLQPLGTFLLCLCFSC